MPRDYKINPLRSVGFIAILLIGLVLAVQYGASWYGFQVAKISKETEFKNYLVDLGKLAQPQLRESAVEIAEIATELADEADATAEPELGLAGGALYVEEFVYRVDSVLRRDFDEFSDSTRLRSLALLDRSGRVLLGTDPEVQPLASFDYLELDREQFEAALAGEVAESLSYEVEAGHVKRVYVPIGYADAASPAAVLCMTAGADYLGELGGLAQNMRLLSAISTVLVLVIGLLVYRVLLSQRRFEEKSAHDDRLRSLGSLAAGFAHEVRNPLEIISAYTQDLERSLAAEPAVPPEAAESCRDVLEEVDRLNRLVNQFLQYSRAEGPAPTRAESVAVGACIESAIGMLRHAAEQRGITIHSGAIESQANLRAEVEESGLRQILINLVMNAIQATPDGGDVRVDLVAHPRQVAVRVTDSGSGVGASIRPRIFDPFFTTREAGSGLGLAIAHQLAVRAGGSLVCAPVVQGRGANFELRLPRVAGTDRQATAVAQPVSS